MVKPKKDEEKERKRWSSGAAAGDKSGYDSQGYPKQSEYLDAYALKIAQSPRAQELEQLMKQYLSQFHRNED